MEDKVKSFIFLYPQEEIFQTELGWGIGKYETSSLEGRKLSREYMQRIENVEREENKEEIKRDIIARLDNSFRETYSKKLNACIDWRYRKKGFSINYAIFDDCSVSDIIKLREGDNIIRVGMDATTHRTKGEDGEYHNYPDNDYILDQMLPLDKLVVSGFHMWDCVEKLARRAYERGLDVLVDEDMTEFFGIKIFKPSFRVKTYPTENPRERGERWFSMFMKPRATRPWLWQDY